MATNLTSRPSMGHVNATVHGAVDYMGTNFRIAKFHNKVSCVLGLEKFKGSCKTERKPLISRRNSVRWWQATASSVSTTEEAKKTKVVRRSEKPYVPPYIRFRRAARAIAMLLKVCKVCKELLEGEVKGESWYAMAENLIDSSSETQTQRKRGRAFVTFVPNEDHTGLDQLTFDASEFSRDGRADHLVTDNIRVILMQTPETRTNEQINELLRCLKKLSDEFNAYPLDVQKRICRVISYDKYQRDRVIIRKGLMADGLYLLLSGSLIEKTEDKKQVKEIKPGSLFGKEDIVCNCARRCTVITRTESEVLVVHRLDYRVIFNMAKDCNDPKYLDICRKNIVFQHFPLYRLVENPAVWTILSFKFGRLMVLDSNFVEWIYVIKSGEARVIKHMTAGRVDMKTRRRKIQAAMDADDPLYKTKQMLEFVSDRDYLKSAYRPKHYNPATLRAAKSAPPGVRHRKQFSYNSLPATPFVSKTPVPLIDLDNTDDEDSHIQNVAKINSESRLSFNIKVDSEARKSIDINSIEQSRYIKTGRSHSTERRRSFKQKEEDNTTEIPPFVQVETLLAGQIFGMRACLEPEEQGPSASLVSGGCEALLINKKFFMKHSDEAVFSLIRVQYKPYPSEEELLDRLDANLQWEEFKQGTLQDFFNSKDRPFSFR